ncbi:MAG TPA: vitamin B12-dependent ribonucleotide reductase [Candidatus Krumholzibacteria bacterium]|nr:vitamin B12-dependent ribonucleotide reductase [Candidatus Krumholzibacteria bacterium]
MITVIESPSLTPNALRVLESRYLRKNQAGDVIETPDQMFMRVARNIASAEERYGADETTVWHWTEVFRNAMTSLDFLPNSPTLMNAGTDIQQLSACFVLPVEDTMDGIFDSLKHTALIHKSGGGTGFSFSRLRPRNDTVQSTQGVSSGPVSFMGVFDAATETVRQGGRRRGANMAMLRVDHPDILDFIDSKSNNDRLNNFNISVAITDPFMDAVIRGEDYDLVSPRTGKVTGALPAVDVFRRIVDRAWLNGEPGIIFIDRVNRDNPTPAVGAIESTNPCGEQPLLPYESCNLGSINLARFVRGELGNAEVDFARLREMVSVAVRFLDNVIDMNCYPLPQIENLTRANRKIGLGVMGFADLLIQMGIRYESPEAEAVAEDVMGCINEAAIAASQALAAERGAFPNFEQSVFGLRNEKPRRNATVTTVAPTGSISIIASVGSGVEPLFGVAFKRRILDGAELVDVNPLFEHIARAEEFYSDGLAERIAQSGGVHDLEEVPPRWRRLFQTAHEVSPEGHVRIQAAFQKHTENAVSKTVNLAAASTREDVEQTFRFAHQLGCKGVTIYRDGSRDLQVLSRGTAATAAAPANAPAVRREPRPRPEIVTGRTTRMETGCGNVYVTTNETADGPFELFAQIGKTGGCAASQTEAIGRLVSLSLRSGVDPRAVARQLRGVRCPYPSWNRGNKVLSCADAIGQALENFVSDTIKGGGPEPELDRAERLAGNCVECGNVLEFEGGCAVCRVCGYSRC